MILKLIVPKLYVKESDLKKLSLNENTFYKS